MILLSFINISDTERNNQVNFGKAVIRNTEILELRPVQYLR